MPRPPAPRRRPLRKRQAVWVSYGGDAAVGVFWCRMPNGRDYNVHTEAYGWDFVPRSRIFHAREDAANAP